MPGVGVTARVWVGALAIGVLLFVACGGTSAKHTAAPAPPTTAKPVKSVEDARVTAATFTNVNDMTRVGDHFVANINGHLAQALAVARSKTGGVYPVGTVLQLVPTEAMVKRRTGFNPSTHDWEFFSLAVSAQGTTILSRGGAQVVNRFGGSCASCHAAAAARFDEVCGIDHGCAPLPVGPAVFALLQKTDPRPR